MKRTVTAAVLCFGLLVARSADARDLPAVEKRALARHMTELTDCLAYYSIAQTALQSSGADAMVERVEEVKSTLLDRAFIVMQVIDMDEAAVLDKQGAAIKEQMALIDNNLRRFSVLTDRYGELCKLVVEKPESRVEHWKRELKSGQQD